MHCCTHLFYFNMLPYLMQEQFNCEPQGCIIFLSSISPWQRQKQRAVLIENLDKQDEAITINKWLSFEPFHCDVGIPISTYRVLYLSHCRRRIKKFNSHGYLKILVGRKKSINGSKRVIFFWSSIEVNRIIDFRRVVHHA